MPYIRKNKIGEKIVRFRRNELANLARRHGFNLSLHHPPYVDHEPVLRLTRRHQRRSFPYPYNGVASGIHLEFAATSEHTPSERVYVYLMLRRNAKKAGS